MKKNFCIKVGSMNLVIYKAKCAESFGTTINGKIFILFCVTPQIVLLMRHKITLNQSYQTLSSIVVNVVLPKVKQSVRCSMW